MNNKSNQKKRQPKLTEKRVRKIAREEIERWYKEQPSPKLHKNLF